MEKQQQKSYSLLAFGRKLPLVDRKTIELN